MSDYIRRQITTTIADGEVAAIEDAASISTRVRDVRQSTVLKIADDKTSDGDFPLSFGESAVLQLPVDYDASKKLHGIISCDNGTAKCVIVSPELTGTSTQLINSVSDNAGVLCFQQRITSITVSNPASSGTINIKYFLFELPDDLDSADSYKDGAQTVGHY